MLGAIIGDIVGSRFEFKNTKSKEFELFTNESCYTDDTVMTLAVADILQHNTVNDKDMIIDTFKKWGRTYPNFGYGGRFRVWLLKEDIKPYNSFGNGSAMRVSAVGWYSNSEEEVIDNAVKVTRVSHNHPEGIKGAVVTAMCIYYARIGKTKEFIKKYVENYYNLDFDYETLRKNYQFNETCQKSVPEAIYCFLISNSFEDCVRTTVSIGGDCDTTSAISCAIAEAYYKDDFDDNMWYDKIISFLPESMGDCKIEYLLKEFIKHKKEILKK